MNTFISVVSAVEEANAHQAEIKSMLQALQQHSGNKTPMQVGRLANFFFTILSARCAELQLLIPLQCCGEHFALKWELNYGL